MPEDVQEEGSLVPLLFSLGCIYSGQIHATFTLPTGKIPSTFWICVLVGPIHDLDILEKDKNILTLLGYVPQIIQPVAWSLYQ